MGRQRLESHHITTRTHPQLLWPVALSHFFRTQCLFFRADSRKNWGFGLALEQILAWWQAAAVYAHAVQASTEAQQVSNNH
jgi:hypothetical protein